MFIEKNMNHIRNIETSCRDDVAVLRKETLQIMSIRVYFRYKKRTLKVILCEIENKLKK